MNIILTDQGLAILQQTSKPLEIVRYELGTGYAYTPSASQTGIKGSLAYSNTIDGPTIINANVYQYSIFLDYTVGPFYFGEIAYFNTENQCVAIAVSENTIEKRAMQNANSGNSLRLDAYLSMVGGTYNTWADSIGSDIKFQIPVVETIDNLPPVKDSDPNCYIVSPMSQDASATLVYTAGNSGLWHFDCYTFENMRAFTVKAATETTVTLDISQCTVEKKHGLLPMFFGDKVVEFSTGNCYSICRVVKSVALQSKSAVLSYRTPMAIVPEVGDTALLFSRSQASRNTLDIPIASTTTIGGIKAGENFSIDLDGTLHLAFNPIKTINGFSPDEAGNIEIPLYETQEIESTDLNECKNMGVYSVLDASEFQNLPSPLTTNFSLEVLNCTEGRVRQRLTSNNKTWWRSFDGESWTEWHLVFSENNPIQVGTF